MHNRTVLITGASTGIGRATALRLDARGWCVYAGVRDEESAGVLQAQASSRLQTVNLDVSQPAQIAQVVTTLQSDLGRRGLGALVNNAGIPVGGPLEYLDLDELRRSFEVNAVAPIAMVKATIELLRVARGRIVFVSSIAARISAPNMGPYSASKHAMSALGESLRAELDTSGIKLVVVEPGAIATDIWTKSQDYGSRLRASLPEVAIERYGKLLDHSEAVLEASIKHAIPPERVAEIIERSLNRRWPRTRYVVGRDAKVAAVAVRFLPDRLRAALVRHI